MRHALGDRLAALAAAGVLRIADPDRAAGHLMLLMSADNLPAVGIPTEPELATMVAAGVDTFLYGHLDGDHR